MLSSLSNSAISAAQQAGVYPKIDVVTRAGGTYPKIDELPLEDFVGNPKNGYAQTDFIRVLGTAGITVYPELVEKHFKAFPYRLQYDVKGLPVTYFSRENAIMLLEVAKKYYEGVKTKVLAAKGTVSATETLNSVKRTEAEYNSVKQTIYNAAEDYQAKIKSDALAAKEAAKTEANAKKILKKAYKYDQK